MSSGRCNINEGVVLKELSKEVWIRIGMVYVFVVVVVVILTCWWPTCD